jgi:hypothetical protein
MASGAAPANWTQLAGDRPAGAASECGRGRCVALRQPAPHGHAITDAVELVLLRCRREGMAFRGWPEETWVDLIGTTVAKFRSTRTGLRIRSAPVVLSGKVSHRWRAARRQARPVASRPGRRRGQPDRQGESV